MVAAVRAGASLRATARQFQVSLLTVQRWVARTAGQRLDRVDWSDQPSTPQHQPTRTCPEVEDAVLSLRAELRETSDLGEFGAAAIRRALLEHGVAGVTTSDLPSVATINRILARRGVFDAKHRPRHAAPPPGWYLPEVARRRVELDQVDVVSGLVIKGGPEVEVLTAISLHGGLIAAWPQEAVSAAVTRTALLDHWRTFGLPAYAQFDNDTRFQGPHQFADVIGSVMRLCLRLGVVPVFAPPRESGFQAAIESLNGRWQAKVWARFQHMSLEGVQGQSARYVAASRQRNAQRIEDAPARRAVPAPVQLDLRAPPEGVVIFLRRTSEAGAVTILGHTFVVDPRWLHRLVRCEVDLSAAQIRFYGLRRREPTRQPLLAQVPYLLPVRPFRV
jgi:hypothetical protein